MMEKVFAHLEAGNVIAETDNIEKEYKCFCGDLKLVLVSTPATCEVASSISGMEYFVKQSGWLEKVHSEQRRLYAAAAIMEKSASEAIAALITQKLGLGADVVSRLAYKGNEIDGIYEVNFVSHMRGQSILSFSHFCASEARLHLRGHELLVGFRLNEVLGNNLSQKLQTLNNMSIDKGLAFAHKAGFVKHLVAAGQFFVCPAGFLIGPATLGERTEYMRWCVAAPPSAEAARSRECATIYTVVQSLLDAYPSLKSGLHSSWRNHVELHQA